MACDVLRPIEEGDFEAVAVALFARGSSPTSIRRYFL